MEAAVPIYREEGSAQAVILDGAHRHAIAIKLGCSTLPCRYVTIDEAKLRYGYPDGQQ
jgi:ParB-like chromosome segregation protein Spo0J